MGHVFVLATEENLRRGDCYSPLEDYEIKSAIPGCDEVVEIVDPEEIGSVFENCNRVYRAIILEPVTSQLYGENPLGILNGKILLQRLATQKSERIEKVSQELAKSNPDLWLVAQEAYNRSEHYFLDSGEALLMNEVDALEFDFEERVYVTQVYEFN